MAIQRSITAANSIYMLAIDGLYPVPQRLQGYSADAAFATEATDGAEVVKGIDDFMSAGWVPTIKQQTITLMPDSDSAFMFEEWIEAQDRDRELIWCDAIITLSAVQRKYTMTRGVLTNYTKIPSVQRTLQPRTFRISWDKIVPAPMS